MTPAESAAGFAAFREVVLDDFHLMMRLRRLPDRAAFVTRVLAIGAERGFAFDEAAVLAAMREGEAAWRTSGAEAP